MNEEKKSIKELYFKFLKAKESGEPTDLEEKKILACLENYKTDWTSVRDQTNANIWKQNISFYAGNHQVRDPAISVTPYRVRVKENHINNILNRMVSIFVQNLPIVRVFPSSASWEDEQNAETTELYGKYFWRSKKIEQKLSKLIRYTSIMGNGFLYEKYNPDEGGEVLIQAGETQSGKSELQKYRGDVDICVLDPFRVAPRPGIDELDDMYDIILAEPGNREELESKYGKIECESATGYNVYNAQLRNDSDRIIINHYYHKPTSWFEEGLYVCWVGKKLLAIKPFPYSKYQKLPIQHLPFDQSPMKFWGMSSIEQLMDLQEQLNRAASMIVESRNLMARPRIFASHESQLAAQSVTDQPGGIMRYKMAGGPPTFVTSNFNFTELANHKSDVRNALAAVSGITGASRGEIPQATKTALALQLVLEQDRSQWLPFIKRFHQVIIDMMYSTLGIAAEYFHEDDPRVVKIEGQNMSRLFHGGIVPSPIDLYLEDTNPLGWTAAGRVEQITTLAQMGILKDRNQVLEMLKLSSPDPAFDLIKISKLRAQKENEKLSQGEFLDIGPEDDDASHLDEHVKIPAAFGFENRPKQVQEGFERHIQQHKDRIQQFQPQQGAAPQKGMAGSMSQVKPEEIAGQMGVPQPSMDQLLAKPG